MVVAANRYTLFGVVGVVLVVAWCMYSMIANKGQWLGRNQITQFERKVSEVEGYRKLLTLLNTDYPRFGSEKGVKKIVATLDPALCKRANMLSSRWEDHLRSYPSGIACNFDWIITETAMYGTTMSPKYIYVTTHGLWIFASVIDSLPNNFVLATAISDETIPFSINDQVKVKGIPNSNTTGLWPKIVNHPKLIHWFIENPSVAHPKVSTLPIGFHNDYGLPDTDIMYAELLDQFNHRKYANHSDRPIQLLSMDRVRHGKGVFALRRLAYDACERNSACTLGYKFDHFAGEVPSSQTNEQLFVDRVVSSRFMVMTHGGGYDPCPKFFHAIVLGTIPIIESNPLDDAYRRFPAVIVPDIVHFLSQNASLVEAQLQQWSLQYAPYYEANSTLREQTLQLMTEKYWWGLMQEKMQEKMREP